MQSVMFSAPEPSRSFPPEKITILEFEPDEEALRQVQTMIDLARGSIPRFQCGHCGYIAANGFFECPNCGRYGRVTYRL